MRRLAWLAIAAAAWLGAPPGAWAQLAPGFVDKLSLDTTFVTGATSATDIAFSADGRALVTRKTGQIVVRHADGTTALIAYPFGGTLDTSSEKGLLGVVADPDVAENRAFYFYVSNGPTADKHRVYRAVLAESSDSLTVDPVPVIAASLGFGPGLEGPANHDGGGMFIHGGQLYVAVGDTGANATPPTNKYGSCLNKGNGKILRVNLDGTVPGDNPLVGLASVSACNTVTGPWIDGGPRPAHLRLGLPQPLAPVGGSADGPALHRRRRRDHAGGDLDRRARPALRLSLRRGDPDLGQRRRHELRDLDPVAPVHGAGLLLPALARVCGHRRADPGGLRLEQRLLRRALRVRRLGRGISSGRCR